MPNRKVVILPSLLTLIVIQLASAARQPTLITAFGAVGDGKTVNTKAIQSAIDQIASSGGGLLVVPKGTFLSGALFFKSGVDLRVEQDGVLKGTTVQADYPLVNTRWEGVEGMHTSAFLNFTDMTHVTVDGEGTIDGSGDIWPGGGRRARGVGAGGATTRPFTRPLAGTTRPAGFVFQQVGRPRLVCFKNCQDVRIADLHLQKQAIWCLHLLYCQDVVVDNVNIRSTIYIPSSDGIDVDSCNGVLIDRCDIACTDDDIAIKSGKDDDGRRVNRPSENITVQDSIFGQGSGVAMGSEVTGSVRHVLVQRCTFNGSSQAARFKSQPSRGGEINDVIFRDITLNNPGQAFDFEMAWDMRLERVAPAPVLTDCHNIQLINFTGTARTLGTMSGYGNKPIHDVKFVNCTITAGRGLRIQDAVDMDTTGLNAKVQQGPTIIDASAPRSAPASQQVN